MMDELRQRDLDDFTGEDDLLDDESEDTDVPIPGDQAAAFRLYRDLARLDRKLGEIASYADAEVTRITLWRTDRSAGFIRRMERTRAAIEAWQRATGAKTVKSPHGTSRLTAPRPSVAVLDQEAFVKWAIDQGYWGLLSLKPYLTAIGRMRVGAAIDGEELTILRARLGSEVNANVLVNEDGTPVPGVVVTMPATPTFTVTPG